MSSLTLQIQTPRKFAPFLNQSRYKGAHGGRGSGKSHFFAEMLVERCILQPGTRAACVREVQKSLKNSVKLLVEDKIRKLGVAHLFEILEAEIRTPGGGIIIFQGMQNHTADSIKSLEGFDVAWVEEAQSLSQRSLNLLRPTIRKPGSELWFTWNPHKPDDPIDVLLRGPKPPTDAIVIEVNWCDNPWFPAELKADMEDDRERDAEGARHIWDGEYSTNSNARILRNWIVKEFEAPKGTIHRFGADWGFAQDPTALVRCHVEGRKLYVDYEAVEVECDIDHTPALFAGDDPRWQNPKRFKGIPGAKTGLIRADSSRPETVSYMRRKGFAITGAVKGPGSLEDGIKFLQSFDIIVHPRCANVRQELRDYSYRIDPHTEEVLSEIDDKDNHTIDALRYALEELRRSGYKPQAEAAKKPRDRWDAAFNRSEGDEDSWKVA